MEERHETETSTVPSFELVSVVIPVLNAAGTLPMQLEALTSQTYTGAWEVVVVDNGSSDGSDEIAFGWSHRLPHLRVVYALDRKGCSHARNVGARAARGDFLAICDADDVVEPGWLEAMAEAGRTCDIVGGRLDRVSLNSPLARSWRPPPSDDTLPSLGFLPYAVGANCGVRTKVFRALGGWNEDLAVCGDDVDFSWRAQLSSYRLCYAQGAVVRYRFREDPRDTARQFFNYGRVQPALYRDYRDRGMSRNLRWAFREWLWLVRHVGDLMGSAPRKGVWMRRAAFRGGRLLGSVRVRVWYP
jgi:glycosyltransferase involved in cell wall biosynthesis